MSHAQPLAIGRYEVLDLIGRGGMGAVYRCRDPRIGRTVAVKVLTVHDDQRFLQEARVAGTLQHPNIVTVFDYGDHDGRPFIVMEYIDGATIAEHLRDRTAFSLERKLALMLDLASGLDYAHARGIVHRDIKPANLIVDGRGVLKILDFGIARILESTLTATGEVFGTLNYMSPEQVEGRPADRRADVFAVGATMYEFLSGQKAFPGDNFYRISAAILHAHPVPLGQVCPGLDPALPRIVETAIQKNPADRYATLALLAADLAAVTRGLERSLRVVDDPHGTATEIAQRDGRPTAATAQPAPTIGQMPVDWPPTTESSAIGAGPPQPSAAGRTAHAAGTVRRPFTWNAIARSGNLLLLLAAIVTSGVAAGIVRSRAAAPNGGTTSAERPRRPAATDTQLPPPAPGAAAQPPIGGRAADTRAPSMAAPPPGSGRAPTLAAAPKDPSPNPAPAVDKVDQAEQECEQGNGSTCVALGERYERGEGVAKDAARAERLFQRGCDSHHGQSCFRLAALYGSPTAASRDELRAAEFLQLGCNYEYGASCARLGAMYLVGRPFPKDESRAASLFERGCNQGNGRGCFGLAQAQESGRGVTQDLTKAALSYQRSCAVNETAGCGGLGWMYYNGSGIEKDEARGVGLFQRACDAGDPPACNRLAIAYAQGRGIGKDGVKATALFQRMCDARDASGCSNLGLSYAQGLGVARDEAKAATLFEGACDNRYARACENLARIYLSGTARPKDDGKAAALYQRACDGGVPSACTTLAGMYDTGRGVAKDPERAKALYQRGRATIAPGAPGVAPAAEASPVATAPASTEPAVVEQPPANVKDGPLRVGGAIKMPVKTKDVPPTYPVAARTARLEGVVFVEATIGEDGKVRQTRIVGSIPLLDAAAENAVKQWQFAPTIHGGIAVQLIVTLPVTFFLGDGKNVEARLAWNYGETMNRMARPAIRAPIVASTLSR